MGLLSAIAQAWTVQRAARDLAGYVKAIEKPRETQERLLFDMLRRERETGFGRDHRFDEIRTVADFRRQVPIRGYDQLEPYIQRVMQGETEALFHRQRVVMFALTSGTTQSRKFIPVTERVLDQYRRVWTAWGLLAFAEHRKLFRHSRLTIVSDWDEFRTPAGIPCGSISGMTAHLQNWVVRQGYVLPVESGKLTDVHAKYYLAWRLGVTRTIGAWLSPNPSTHLNLARFGEQAADRLIKDVHDGTLTRDFEWPEALLKAIQRRLKPQPARARELETLRARAGRLLPKDVWPELGLIGCWTGGSMGAYLRSFPEYFGDVAVRDLGLVASEGRMTFPIADRTPSGVLEIVSSYFEFIPVAEIDSPQPTVLGAEELQEGGEYFILLTNASGLYRYNIHDVVRCTGFHKQTPLLEFLNKGSGFSSVTGEKLSDHQVSRAIEAVLAEFGLAWRSFGMAPGWGCDQIPYYSLYVEESELPDRVDRKTLAEAVDARLQSLNCEYASKRQSWRLGNVCLVALPDGFWERWDRARQARTGGTSEQYKRPLLLTEPPQVPS